MLRQESRESGAECSDGEISRHSHGHSSQTVERHGPRRSDRSDEEDRRRNIDGDERRLLEKSPTYERRARSSLGPGIDGCQNSQDDGSQRPGGRSDNDDSRSHSSGMGLEAAQCTRREEQSRGSKHRSRSRSRSQDARHPVAAAYEHTSMHESCGNSSRVVNTSGLAATEACEESSPYAFRIAGFLDAKLNGTYVCRPDLKVNDVDTFWSFNDFFMYYQPAAQWAISPHMDDGDDLFLAAMKGGTRALAYQPMESDAHVWLEFFGESWQRVVLNVTKLTLHEYKMELTRPILPFATPSEPYQLVEGVSTMPAVAQPLPPPVSLPHPVPERMFQPTFRTAPAWQGPHDSTSLTRPTLVPAPAPSCQLGLAPGVPGAHAVGIAMQTAEPPPPSIAQPLPSAACAALLPSTSVGLSSTCLPTNAAVEMITRAGATPKSKPVELPESLVGAARIDSTGNSGQGGVETGWRGHSDCPKPDGAQVVTPAVGQPLPSVLSGTPHPTTPPEAHVSQPSVEVSVGEVATDGAKPRGKLVQPPPALQGGTGDDSSGASGHPVANVAKLGGERDEQQPVCWLGGKWPTPKAPAWVTMASQATPTAQDPSTAGGTQDLKKIKGPQDDCGGHGQSSGSKPACTSGDGQGSGWQWRDRSWPNKDLRGSSWEDSFNDGKRAWESRGSTHYQKWRDIDSKASSNRVEATQQNIKGWSSGNAAFDRACRAGDSWWNNSAWESGWQQYQYRDGGRRDQAAPWRQDDKSSWTSRAALEQAEPPVDVSVKQAGFAAATRAEAAGLSEAVTKEAMQARDVKERGREREVDDRDGEESRKEKERKAKDPDGRSAKEKDVASSKQDSAAAVPEPGEKSVKRARAAAVVGTPPPAVGNGESSGFQPTIHGFYLFMREREVIRIRRNQGDPWPWTDDPVLQRVRISNVKREHDRTSVIIRRLLGIQAPAWDEATTTSERERLARGYVITVALWRRFGTVEFIDQLGFQHLPNSEAELKELTERVLNAAVAVWRQGAHACTDAYAPAKHCHRLEDTAWKPGGMDTNLSVRRQARVAELREAERSGILPRSLAKMRMVLVSRGGEKYVRNAYAELIDCATRPIRSLWEQSCDVAASLGYGMPGQSWRRPAETLRAVKGYSAAHGQHAAEIVRDLFGTPLLENCTDRDSWVPVGSGAKRCLNRLHSRDVGKDIHTDQLQRELLDVFAHRCSLWPGRIGDEPSVSLHLHDVQSQLAEFDRYLKAQAGIHERATFYPRTGR